MVQDQLVSAMVVSQERKPDSAVNEPLNPDTFVMSVQNMLWLPMRDVWVPSTAEIKSTARPGVIFFYLFIT